MATWQLSGPTIPGGANLGAPGAVLGCVGVGDFNGDGATVVLFKNAGVYSEWEIGANGVVGGGTKGNPGATLAYKGVADIFGNRQSSIRSVSNLGSLGAA